MKRIRSLTVVFLFVVTFWGTPSLGEELPSGEPLPPIPGTEEDTTPHTPYFFDGEVAYNNTATSNTITNVVGVAYGMGGGVRLGVFSFSAFYQGMGGATGDFGLLGGGFYLADFLGVRAEITPFGGETNLFSIGAETGKMWITGIRGVLLLPYAADKLSTWTAGPVFTYTRMIRKNLGLGVRTTVLISRPTDAVSSGVNSATTSVAPFVNFTLGFRVEYRI